MNFHYVMHWRAFHLFWIAFFSGLGSYGGSVYIDALFLSKMGSVHLPFAYFATGILLILSSSLMLWALHYLNNVAVYRITLLSALSFYIGLFLFQSHFGDTLAVWILLRACSYSLLVVVGSTFWNFIDDYTHLQEAKTLFAWTSALLFAGFASGGYLISQFESASGLWACFSLALFLAWVATLLPISETESFEEGESEPLLDWKTFAQKLLCSRFACYLLLANMLTQLLSVCCEFLYMENFEQYFFSIYPQELAQIRLTQFIGELTASVSIFNIAFACLIFGALANRIGVANLSLITPLCYIATFLLWQGSFPMLPAICGFILVEGVMYTHDDTTFALLLNGAPKRIKSQVRLLAETLFEPLGMLLCGGIMLLPFAHKTYLGICISFSLLIVAFFVRKHYRPAILDNLKDKQLDLKKERFNQMLIEDPKRREKLIQTILYEQNSQEAEFILKSILDHKRFDILNDALLRLEKVSYIEPSIRRIIQKLSQHPGKAPTSTLDILGMLNFTSLSFETISLCLAYLRSHGRLLQKTSQLSQVFHPDLGIDLEKLQQMSQEDTPIFHKYLLEQLASSSMDRKISILPYLVHSSMPGALEHLKRIANTSSTQVAKEAVLSLSRTPWCKGLFSSLLQVFLKQNNQEFRQLLLSSLCLQLNIDHTQSLLAHLSELTAQEQFIIERSLVQNWLPLRSFIMSCLSNRSSELGVRKIMASVLHQVDDKLFYKQLGSILDPEIHKAYHYLYHSQTLKERYPEHSLAQLISCLESAYQRQMEFILDLLALSGPLLDSKALWIRIEQATPKTRAMLLEMLEKSCSRKQYKLLQPLLEKAQPLALICQKYRKKHPELACCLKQLLDQMENSPHKLDRLMSASIKYKLEVPGGLEAFHQQSDAEANQPLATI